MATTTKTELEQAQADAEPLALAEQPEGVTFGASWVASPVTAAQARASALLEQQRLAVNATDGRVTMNPNNYA